MVGQAGIAATPAGHEGSGDAESSQLDGRRRVKTAGPATEVRCSSQLQGLGGNIGKSSRGCLVTFPIDFAELEQLRASDWSRTDFESFRLPMGP